jgi:hypothetical protein
MRIAKSKSLRIVYSLLSRFHQITAATIVVVAISASELKHKMHQIPNTRPSM